MAKKNKVEGSAAAEDNIESIEVQAPSSRPKRDIIRDAITAGGATRESLMKLAGVNKAGFASQLTYLNLIAMGAKTGYPLTDDKGVFYLGTQEEYDAKVAARPGFGRSLTPKTPEQLLEAARKREDKASAKLTNCKKKMETEKTEENILRVEIAERELRLASILLGKAEQGDFSQETSPAASPADPDTDLGDPNADDVEML